MNHIAITREGDDDGIVLDDGVSVLRLGSLRPEFVKKSKNKNKIVFVGMYTIKMQNESIIIYSLPKYFPREKCNKEYIDEIQQHIKKICKVVEKLRSEGKSFDDDEHLFNPYEQKISKETVNRAELAEYIIEDYLQNGIYIKDITENRKDGRGRTNWAKTVTKIKPVIQEDTPIYLNLVNKHHIIDENDFLSVIHANVLNQCLAFMGTLISDGIDYIETESLGEDLSAFASTINAYSTYIFKEREINLFKALEAWCSATRFYENYAGVTCFDRVWEWVNDAVWGNVKEVNSSNPVYHIGDKEYLGVGEAIPDTIRIEQIDGAAPKTYIYDSKYYTVSKLYSEDGNRYHILGFPANSDIVKQVAYLKLIKSQFICSEFFNSFLLPEVSGECGEKEQFTVPVDDWFNAIGYVKPGKFNGLELDLRNADTNENEDKVGIVLENPDKLYDKYLNGIRAESKELQRTEKYCMS